MQTEEHLRWMEIIPAGQTDSPTLWWPAHRFIQGVNKFQELQATLNEITQGWDGSTTCRAPKEEAEQGFPSMRPVGNIGISVESKRKATLLASESLFHIRSALDQTIYQSVWRDSGYRNSKTCFPLARSAKAWKDRVKHDLAGLNSSSVDFIRTVQPFTGTQWTSHLSNLSNRDKHRTTVEVTPSIRFKIDTARRYKDPLHDNKYFGFAVEESSLFLRVIPAEHDSEGTERLDASALLVRIAEGAAQVINFFLAMEEGMALIEFEVPPEVPEL